MDFVYRIPNGTEALGTFIERNGHYFGVEFVGICKTVQERANEYYEPLSGLYQDLEIPLDIAKMEVDRDEFIKSVRKLEQAIREQVGGNIP